MEAQRESLKKLIDEAEEEIHRIDCKRYRTDADMDRVEELCDRIDDAKAKLDASR